MAASHPSPPSLTDLTTSPLLSSKISRSGTFADSQPDIQVVSAKECNPEFSVVVGPNRAGWRKDPLFLSSPLSASICSTCLNKDAGNQYLI
uniref:Uncharacterized protein n=1 Tax=Oryza brachyantha TaxID=4533 RepID=J3LSV6_ORYBR